MQKILCVFYREIKSESAGKKKRTNTGKRQLGKFNTSQITLCYFAFKKKRDLNSFTFKLTLLERNVKMWKKYNRRLFPLNFVYVLVRMRFSWQPNVNKYVQREKCTWRSSSYFKKLQKEGKAKCKHNFTLTNGQLLHDPYGIIENWKSDAKLMPDVSWGDMYNYLINSPSEHTHDNLQATYRYELFSTYEVKILEKYGVTVCIFQ